MNINAGIIGATGYAGAELVRLLAAHPAVTLAALSSVSYEGKVFSEVYPAFYGVVDKLLVTEDEVIEQCDVVFASLPHGLSEKLAKKCNKKGSIFIDLGADFRLEDEADYTEWYGLTYAQKELHKQAVYALPELFRNQIKSSKLLANPGCYPTSIALALAPLLKKSKIDTDSIIIDSKSGATGAGRGLSLNTHFTECNESFAPYKIAQHRHTPEIEQTLSHLCGKRITVTFVPHLLPINRGILSTIYAKLSSPITADELHGIYTDFYKDEQFVRILKNGDIAALKAVRCSNFCDISLHLDTRTGRVVLVSAIDNMVKGAAGQAIQNMNLVLGLPEETGLKLIAPSF
ncbi:MAG: N-acetyl-gamma-glutamyl-phosphate reductase [Hydrogenoanaerobacterium sp.]